MLELVEKMHLVTGPFLFRTGKHPKMFGMIYGWFRRMAPRMYSHRWISNKTPSSLLLYDLRILRDIFATSREV